MSSSASACDVTCASLQLVCIAQLHLLHGRMGLAMASSPCADRLSAAEQQHSQLERGGVSILMCEPSAEGPTTNSRSRKTKTVSTANRLHVLTGGRGGGGPVVSRSILAGTDHRAGAKRRVFFLSLPSPLPPLPSLSVKGPWEKASIGGDFSCCFFCWSHDEYYLGQVVGLASELAYPPPALSLRREAYAGRWVCHT